MLRESRVFISSHQKVTWWQISHCLQLSKPRAFKADSVRHLQAGVSFQSPTHSLYLSPTSSILNTKPKSRDFSVNSPRFLLEPNSKENMVLSPWNRSVHQGDWSQRGRRYENNPLAMTWKVCTLSPVQRHTASSTGGRWARNKHSTWSFLMENPKWFL